jgi:hypothetical protein
VGRIRTSCFARVTSERLALSRRNKHQKKKSQRELAKGRGPWYSEFKPFEGIPHDEVIAHLKSLGEKRAEDFPKELSELKKSILSCDPVQMLGTMSFFGQSAFLKKDGSIEQPKTWIQQHHVELIQALALQSPLSEYAVFPPQPQLIQAIWDRVLSVSDAFSQKRLVALGSGETSSEKAALLLQEQMRLHTQIVRNWGFPDRVVSLVKELLQPIDSIITGAIGYSLSSFFELSLKLMRRMNERQNEHFESLRDVFRGETIEDLVKRYYAAFEYIEGNPEDLIEYLSNSKADLERARYLILSHSELSLASMKTFSAKEFEGSDPQNAALTSLSGLLDSLSYSFGDLAGVPPEHLILDNPCWSRPIIKLSDGEYFEPLPSLPISFPFEIIEYLLKNHPDLLSEYHERRSVFLEERIEEDMKRALPEAQITRGNLWVDDSTGDRFENDLLVVYDCFALVIEAKSGHVTPPARRGALGRLEKVTEELIESASVQSQRFAEWIEKNNRVITLPTRTGLSATVDLSHVRFVLRLSVLLDDVATVQTMAYELQEAGLIPPQVKLAVTMTLTDFEIVLDLLSSPSLLFHYFQRRSMIGAHTTFMADELDLLGFYLDTGFNIGTKEFDGTSLILTGMSKSIDEYYMSGMRGTQAKKPYLELTKWWGDMIKHLEQKRPSGWLRVTLKLLSVPQNDQLKVEQEFHRTMNNVKRNWRKENHRNVVLLAAGPPQRREGLAFLAYREVDQDKRRYWSENAASMLREEAGVKEVVVIGHNIDRQDYPWTFLASYYMGTQEIQII